MATGCAASASASAVAATIAIPSYHKISRYFPPPNPVSIRRRSFSLPQLGTPLVSTFRAASQLSTRGRKAHLPRRAVCSSSGGSGEVTEPEEEISRATLLWRAAKLPIYSVAVVPLTVGSAAAYLETGLFVFRRYLVLLGASILIITWLNLSNDVYDFDTGADQDKKESVVNITGSRMITYYAAIASLLVGFMGLIWASLESGDVRTILLLTSAILCGYMYQCPPFRLSYKGLGEPLCFAAFGPFATTAFYFSQGGKHLFRESPNLPLSGIAVSVSLLVGLTTTLILFCSHFHQIDGDLDVGKMSPLVRIGTRTGLEVVRGAIVVLYSLLPVLVFAKVLPLISALLCALTLPVGKLVMDYVQANRNDKAKIFMAKYYCVRLHALFGAALATGLVLAGRASLLEFLRPFIP